MKTIHEIDPKFKSWGKVRLMYCPICETDTVHSTPFFGCPFRCAANHGGMTECCSCHAFVAEVAKVVIDAEGGHYCFCALCCEPDSPEKQRKLKERREQMEADARKSTDLNDPMSIARALGASSFRTTRQNK